jgi:drug/metabolite transporter (DMT)-like permease
MKNIGIFSGVAASAIWGGMYVISKVVLDVVPPFLLLTIRLILGSLTLGIIVALKGGIGFSRQQFLQVIGVGWVGYGVSVSLQFIGTKLSSASNGALVTSSVPAFILLFAALIMHERITARKLLALLISSTGVLVVIDPRTMRLSPELFLGNLSLVAASITWALYSVLVRKVTRNLGTLPVSLVAFWGGFLVTLPGSAWELRNIGVGSITPGVIWGILYLGIISTALAMYLWNTAFAMLDAGVASLTLFAQPVVGAGLGAIFLGEQLTSLFLIGGLLICLGVWLASTGTATSPPSRFSEIRV